MIASRGLLVVGLLALLAAGIGAVVTSDDSGSTAWVTSPDDTARRLLPVTEETRPATVTVRVDPGDRRQEWRGTGAALTDASVELLSGAPDGVDLLFDPQDEQGARLNWIRLPLTATDMSPSPWTWGWDGRVASPSPQARDSSAMAREIAQLRPELQVVATPWSAPVWMKEPRGIRGGALRDDQLDQYADMLVAQARALGDAGVPLEALTLGNEPGFSTDYPSMTMSDEQQISLAERVAPGLPE